MPRERMDGSIEFSRRELDELKKLKAEVERLKQHAHAEYQRGLEEGRATQAILEIQGRERFLNELKAAEAAGGEPCKRP